MFRRVGIALRIAAGCALFLGKANAQVQVPAVPQLPSIQLPLNPGNTLGAARDSLDPRRLQDLRLLRVRNLLRTYRRELEADPNGAPMIRSEIVAYGPSEASLRIAIAAGFTVLRESTLSGLDNDAVVTRVVVLTGRSRAATRAELRRLRRADPLGSYDFNHLYIESGAVGNELIAPAVARDAESKQFTATTRIGLIDTGVDQTHPSLNAAIAKWGCEGQPVAGAHGTAVASLLVGDAPGFKGAAPDASLFAADVYCGKPTGGSVETIANAFAWLAREKVPVINVSLVGPANVLLEKIVASMVARGHIVVAAVGNDGPAARPLYPAAYPGVVGVTGVDARRRVLVEALRGPQVDFAAPGSDMAAAGSAGYVAVRGTSFAAPIVAGLLAKGWAKDWAQGWTQGRAQRQAQLTAEKTSSQLDFALAQLTIDNVGMQALDLGARGTDKVYGLGLLGEAVRTAPGSLADLK